MKIVKGQIHKEIENIYLQFQANFSTQDCTACCLMRYLHASSMLNRRTKHLWKGSPQSRVPLQPKDDHDI